MADKVYYHGTDSPVFNKFENKYIGKNKANPSQLGHWFSDDKTYARGHGKNILEASVKLENPKIYTQEQWSKINKKGDFLKLRETLENKGYDGIKVQSSIEKFAGQEVRNPELVSVFNTAKIKSITESVEGIAKIGGESEVPIIRTVLKGAGRVGLKALPVVLGGLAALNYPPVAAAQEVLSNPQDVGEGSDLPPQVRQKLDIEKAKIDLLNPGDRIKRLLGGR